MEQERWTVLEHRGVERDEISWHYSPEKAKQVAQDHANRTGNTTTVDLNVGQLTRYGGWVVEDGDADLWSFTPSPATAELTDAHPYEHDQEYVIVRVMEWVEPEDYREPGPVLMGFRESYEPTDEDGSWQGGPGVEIVGMILGQNIEEHALSGNIDHVIGWDQDLGREASR